MNDTMSLKKIIKNNWILFILYLFVLGLCIYLNWYNGKAQNSTGIFISILMFAIVLIIFTLVLVKSFIPMDKITETLMEAKERIIRDSGVKKSDETLYEDYYGEKATVLIDRGPLAKEFSRFQNEQERLKRTDSGYRCNIEDYINEEVIDQKVSKSFLGMIPGALTGMGILGTFIGLAVGLQGFSFGGSADDVLTSMTPLMDGLKVAFHTSIYGMIFSLVFNLITKMKFNTIYSALEDFLTEFSRSVVPDAANDNQSRMLLQQQSQNEKINENLQKMVNGQTELNSNLTGYSKKMADAQANAMKKLARDFVSEMSDSLYGDFQQMHEIIEKTGELQSENTNATLQAVSKVTSMTKQLNEVNRLSVNSVDKMEKYIEKMNQMQSSMNSFMTNINAQLEEVRKENQLLQEYIHQISDNEGRLVNTVEKNTEVTNQMITSVSELQSSMIENAQKQYREYTDSSIRQNELLAKAAENQISRIAAYSEYQAKLLADIVNSGKVIKKGFFARILDFVLRRKNNEDSDV